MNLDKFTGPGSTPSRRRFWDKVQELVMASQKMPGRNASVDERRGKGTIITFPDQTPSAPQMGGCCVDGDCSITTESDCSDAGGNYLGNSSTCDDVDCTQGACCKDGDCSITTSEDCDGTYQGDGTTCDDVDCGEATSGACCIDDDCSILSPAGCSDAGGVYQGDDITCDDVTCGTPPCGGCFFDDGMGGFWRKKTKFRHGFLDQSPCVLAFTCVAQTGECNDEEHTFDDECMEVITEVPNGIFWITNNEKDTPFTGACDEGHGCSTGEFSTCVTDTDFTYSEPCTPE